MMTKAELLKQVPLFASLEERELAALAQVAYMQRYSRGGVILIAREEGDTLFIIVEGRVKVVVQSEDGREIILRVMGPGSFFGDMSLLDGQPRSASVIALEATSLLGLRRADFLALLERHFKIVVGLLRELTGRLRRTDAQVEDLAFLNVTGRVKKTLLKLAQEEGVEVTEGLLIRRRPTQEELAAHVGTSRETISRVIHRLQREGYLVLLGRDLILSSESVKTDLLS